METESRKEQILAAVVEEYTKTGFPVGSDAIAEKYVSASPATIRAEMAELEEEGFLHQPHISAGRVPTDQGFRYFVNQLMREKPLSLNQQKDLELQLLESRAQYARLARTTAKLLSGFSKTFAIAGFLEDENFYESGIKEFLTSSEFTELDQIAQAAEILDYLDEWLDEIVPKKLEQGTQIFIGEENPISQLRDYSMIISDFGLPDGRKGYIAIVGPKRMRYDKNIPLVEFVRGLLGKN
ncbi:MAG: hypothetical protein V1698_01155 [bacterium]